MPKFTVAKSITIDAPAEAAFAAAANFDTWTTWSPWLCSEPDANVTVTGPEKAVGAKYAWSGDVVGAGEIEHRELVPPRQIVDDLRFTKPHTSECEVTFEFAEQTTASGAPAVDVTWRMDGAMPWFLFWMIPQLKTFIGMDYARGLRMLKEYVETGTVLSSSQVLGVVETEPLLMAGIRQQANLDEVGPVMDTAFARAKDVLESTGVDLGESLSVYHHFDMKTGGMDFTSGFRVPRLPATTAELSVTDQPAGRALCVEHRGRYDNLGNAWATAYMFARHQKLKLDRKSPGYEVYLNEKGNVPDSELLTRVYVPLK